MSAIETGDKITRKYSNFRGVDFRGDECGLNRSPDSLNVWRNYKKLASIETRPGLEHVYTYRKGIRSMMWHNDMLYFLANDGFLHALDKDGTLWNELAYVGSNAIMFSFDGKLYAKGSAHYVNVTEGKIIVPYIPTTSIGRKPSGGGKTHEDVNMLCPYRINTFLGDGESKRFVLDARDLDEGFVPIVTVTENGEETPYEISSYGREKGFVTLLKAPPKPDTDGQDNVSIKFKRSNAANESKILKCTIAQEFDNRIFLSGNPDYPSTIWHSSLSDPSYFSDLDYYVDGVDQAPIRSMVAGNNGLWVFRDESDANSSVFYHTPALDEDYGKVYPSSHSSIALGCVGRAVNFNDDTIFFSQRGMESASTDITTEQFVTHRSSLVDRKMLARAKYKDMILAEWEGYLLVFIGNEVFLADSRAVMTNENHIEYEWYHWKLGKYNITCAAVHDGVLYIGTDGDTVQDIPEGHIYKLTREAKDGDEHSGYYPDGSKWEERMHIESYWTTPKDRFGAQNKLKTTNKKGCVVEATGDIDVYAKVEDTDFEHIGKFENIADYFACRIKRKKFKDIQLKFQSATGFSLESATLECFIGGYIKR